MKVNKLNLLIILALLIVGLAGSIEAAGQPPIGLLVPDKIKLDRQDQHLSIENLYDQDILTEPDFQNKSTEYIYFTFDTKVDLNLFKMYLKESSQAIVGLEYLTEEGIWISIPEVNFINCAQLNQSWNRFSFDIGKKINQLRLRIEGMKKGSSGIGEVEFWGQSAGGFPFENVEYQMDENITMEFHGGSAPKGDTAPQSVHVTIESPVRCIKRAELIYDVYDLEQYVEGFWQINGGGYHYLTPPGQLKTWTTAVEKIDPTLLVEDENEISFKIGNNKKNGFKITNVGLRLYYDNGERTVEKVEGAGVNEELLSNLIDGNPETYWETDWQQYDQISFKLYLAEEIDLEYITWLQDARIVDYLRIEYLESDEWRLFSADLEEKDLQDGWNVVQTKKPVKTDQIRFTIMNPKNKQLIGSLKEIKVWGSRIKSRILEPEIQITYPQTGEIIKVKSLVKGYVRGDYDSIKINGQNVSVTNNYFEAELNLNKQTGNEDFIRTIIAEAYKNGKLVSQNQVVVTLKPTPIVEINSPIDGYLTEADQVLIEGTTDLPTNSLYLNDQWFGTDLTYFQINHQLEEGVNPVTVKAVSERGLSKAKTIYIRRDQQAPIIYFAEDYNNRVLGEVMDFIIINGYVEDYSRCELFVNGQEFVIESENFSYPVNLQPGYNEFTFRFIDELGHESSESICLIQDSTPPNPFTPTADPTNWSQLTQPVVSFCTTDDQAGINHYEISIDGKDYVFAESPYTLPVLEDGIHTIRVKVVDNVGLETVGTSIKVYVDATPPQEFEAVANPNQWSQITQAVITFGTVDEHSGISRYELKVDDEEYLEVESPFTLPQLNDGVHSIKVKAIDNVGLSTISTVQVYVDTTSPEEFVPLADPADWDKVNQPIISFTTIDRDSGINHFKLKIDDGGFVTVESPYQLPVLEDGVHDITIKAIDNVELETIGTTKVYVDTTPPEVPADFKVCPGDGEVLIKWIANTEEDLIEYRLYRQPVWEDTEVKYIEPIKEPKFLDVDVVNENEYTYYLEAVDHVENISLPTAALTEKVGIASVEVIPEEGGEVQYGDDVAVNIPADAMEESGTIQIVTAEDNEVPEVIRPKVSKIYKLDIVDEQGQLKEEPQFEKEISISLGYDETLIPEGYSELDLDVYYYNELDSLWVIMPKVEVDIFENKITVNSNHFSMYSVQVTENYSPAAESYNDLGIAPYNSYFNNNQEFVSTGSASLNINTVDVSLPGRNGFNLSLGRIYNSNQAAWDGLEAGKPVYASFGDGWRLNLARIVDNSHGEYIYLEDGTAIKVDWNKGEKIDGYRTNNFEYHKGNHFTAYKKQKNNYVVFWEDISYEIYFKDGRKYEFDEHGRLIRMIDLTGNNIINISYSDNTDKYSEISKIIDSVGREIRFSYSANHITGIYVNSVKFVTYGYVNNLLNSVTDRMNRVTSYSYENSSVRYGGAYEVTTKWDYEDPNMDPYNGEITEEDGNIKDYNISVLEKIKYPMGGISKYSYSIVTDYERKTIDKSGEDVDEMGYKYTYTQKGYSKSYTFERITFLDNIKYLSSSEIEEIDPVDYDFTYNDDNQITKAVINKLYQRIEMEFNDDGLNTVKRIYNIRGDSTNTEIPNIKEEYKYNQQNAIIEKIVYHNGQEKPSYYDQFSYDIWGNVTYSYNSESGAEFYYYYLNARSEKPSDPRFIDYDESQPEVSAKIHNLLADQFVINHDPINKTNIPQQIHYQYDSNGNIKAEAKRHGSSWIKTRFEHDDYGNIIKVTDALGNISESIYDANHLYPLKVIKDAGLDADGNLQPKIVVQYGYNQLLGVKEWEIDANGALYTYSYDILGRLVSIIYPDENDIFCGTIGSLNPDSYLNREDNPIKVQIYNDIKNTTTVVNLILGTTTIDDAINTVQLIETIIPENENPKILNMSKYEYDGMGRWIALKQYLKASELQTIDGQKQTSPFVTIFGYDKVGNRTKIVDAEGFVTFKVFDGFNRMTDIYYPDETKYKAKFDSSNNHLLIEYDKTSNKRKVIDPSGRITEEIKDWNENVIEFAKYDDGQRYLSHATFDELGNQVAAVDGKGQAYTFIYDDLNQLVEKKLPETEMILPNTSLVVNYRSTIKYDYDDLGRQITEITPNGVATPIFGDHRIEYVYDAAGRVTQTIANKNKENLVTKSYYDTAGHPIRVVDPEGYEVKKVYHPRGWELAEIDQLGQIVYHQYDELGNQTALIDPRGVVKADKANFDGCEIDIFGETYRLNPEYTTIMEYDSLGRNIKNTDLMGNIHEIQFDMVGNKRFEIVQPGPEFSDSKLQLTQYDYTPQYWVESITRGTGDLTYKIEYEYDKVGNKTREIYPPVQGMAVETNNLEFEYDGFGRLVKVIRPDGNYERYEYDAIGNQTALINARGITTRYYYNGLNKIAQVLEPTGYSTNYYYDPNANLVQKVMANGLTTDYKYNNLNQLVDEVKVRAGDVMRRKFAYNKVSNLMASIDAKDNVTSISYYENAQVKEQVYYRPASENYQIPDLNLVSVEIVPAGYELDERANFIYDQTGNLKIAVDGLGSLEYIYDKMNRITMEKRSVDNNSYTTEYQYDFLGNLNAIKYPNRNDWIKYNYNDLNQLVGISQVTATFAEKFKIAKNIRYDLVGNLVQMTYNNGVTTLITPEVLSRPEKIQVKNSYGQELLDLNYAYDENGNITHRNNNVYTYDDLDRLKTAEVDGTLLVDQPAKKGYVDTDYFINRNLDYEIDDKAVDFDYAASTIGLKFETLQTIGRIELIPAAFGEHRIKKGSIRILYRRFMGDDFIEIHENDWVYDLDTTGKIILTLKAMIEAGEIKIHSNFDDRTVDTREVINKAEFSNLIKNMVKVYGRYNRTQITYDYDQVGNRISETYTDPTSDYSITYGYEYYSNSNRLKTRESQTVENLIPSTGNYVDGLLRVGSNDKKAYQYDQVGNLIAKGNSYSMNGEDINFTLQSEDNSTYWKYQYNAKNRLTDVFKNGKREADKVASYGYDFTGKRLMVEERGQIIYYIYNYLGQLVYEKHEDKEFFYIYAYGRCLAKVEGIFASNEEVYYYYNHDNLGSTMLMTDAEGQVVFEQNYTSFGQDLYKPGSFEKTEQQVEAGFKYTGQIEEDNIGLYYYNARYYDPEIGRFIREDDYQGNISNPQTLNLYTYTANNPMRYVDPSGHSYADFLNFTSMFFKSDARGVKAKWNQRDSLIQGVPVDEVTKAQASLAMLGYDLGAYGLNKNGVDGKIGKMTGQAITDFQKIIGLEATGQLDSMTMLALDSAVGSGVNKLMLQNYNFAENEYILIVTISESAKPTSSAPINPPTEVAFEFVPANAVTSPDNLIGIVTSAEEVIWEGITYAANRHVDEMAITLGKSVNWIAKNKAINTKVIGGVAKKFATVGKYGGYALPIIVDEYNNFFGENPASATEHVADITVNIGLIFGTAFATSAAGSAVGSIIPGAGNLTGAVGGFVAGFIISVACDGVVIYGNTPKGWVQEWTKQGIDYVIDNVF
ncbi:MAG: peptidoglycan-binding protein [Halanaerobiales bacterium]|nr:peptidoglycan-binding protein [Halanaerobiales bacterium]